jgi:hypothetical protein
MLNRKQEMITFILAHVCYLTKDCKSASKRSSGGSTGKQMG